MKVINSLDIATKWICGKFMYVSAAAAATMLFLTVIDIVGSKLFNHPIRGAIDYVGILLMMIGAFGLAQTEVLGKHIRVEFLTVRFNQRGQLILQFYNAILGIFIFVMAIWACFRFTMSLFRTGDSTMTMEVPWWPFMGLLAVNLVLLLLVIIGQALDACKKLTKKGVEKG
jgi:TRAP-type C4-dicarboxylate transport system permease small subunit